MYYNGSTAISASEGLVGAVSPMNESAGFKDDITQICTMYAGEGVDIIESLGAIASNRDNRDHFVDAVCESLFNVDAFKDGAAVEDPYFSSYTDRFHQYLENSMVAMARESVMTGYSPIQSYAPFMLKRQWVSCVWKDVLQAEIAKSNIVKIGIEERWLVDGSGNRYRVPDVYYNKELMRKLYNDGTGINLKEEPLNLPIQNVCIISKANNASNTTVITGTTQTKDYEFYEEPLVVRNPRETMTHDYTIFQVVFKDSQNKEHIVPCDIKPDLASKTLIGGGDLRCTVFNDDGSIKEILADNITGYVDFDTGTISVFSTGGKITKIYHRGKAVNRFNHRTLSTDRTVSNKTFYMGESGPRLNAAITVEEAQDAIAVSNTDLYADQVDMMGDTLANLQDFNIRSFAMNSYERFSKMPNGPLGYEENFTAYGSFNATPNALGVGITVDVWMNQSKEYFERFLDELAYKLKAENVTFVSVCHPKLIRYLRTELKWIFSDQTDVSGIKLQHKIGVSTTDGKRIHFITSIYMDPDDGVYTLLIPNTSQIITMKHIMHSAIIDRGYQNPLEPLVPNVMSTQRSLTFEVSPVQGFFEILGRDSVAPSTHGGRFQVNTYQETTNAAGGGAGGASGSGGTGTEAGGGAGTP